MRAYLSEPARAAGATRQTLSRSPRQTAKRHSRIAAQIPQQTCVRCSACYPLACSDGGYSPAPQLSPLTAVPRPWRRRTRRIPAWSRWPRLSRYRLGTYRASASLPADPLCDPRDSTKKMSCPCAAGASEPGKPAGVNREAARRQWTPHRLAFHQGGPAPSRDARHIASDLRVGREEPRVRCWVAEISD